MSDNEILDLLKYNLIQQNDANPFAFMPEDKRPEGYQILDQLKNPPQAEEGAEGTGMEGETPPTGEEEIPPEVEDQFGPPPEDIGEPPAEDEEVTEETPEEEDMGEEPEIEEDETEEAPTPELAGYAFREKRKNIYLEKQKSLKLKNKIMTKIINEEKENEKKEILKEENGKKQLEDIAKLLMKTKKKKRKIKKNLSIDYMENNNEFIGLNKIINKDNTFFG